MTSDKVSSWGNVTHAPHAIYDLWSRYDLFPALPANSTVLPFGNGRSYGDSCLNPGGALLRTRSLDRFIAFDRNAGTVTIEAGVLLSELLRVIVPSGWFLPVVPGTSYVTVGGAIANDVHGKNHHRAGTFGRHVTQLELLRSDGKRFACSPAENAQWFAATVGGLGLTGVITWARLQLRRMTGPWMDVETIKFANVHEFFELCDESDKSCEYTVSWIDCHARGKSLGRGLLQRANHAGTKSECIDSHAELLRVPCVAPVSLINSATVRVFNAFHFHQQRAKHVHLREHFRRFFFPLDRIQHWNRLYGRRGFFQYQCAIPEADRQSTVKLLETIARSGQGSSLAVLKRFGTQESPGMLSFPRMGVTLALDFPNNGAPVERLFTQLDDIVEKAGGRLYPAKDSRMPGVLFRNGYPCWREFAPYIDPACSSGFWRRVTETA